MAPRKAQAAAKTKIVAVKKAVQNGKIKKAAKLKKLSEPAKKNVKEEKMSAVAPPSKKVQTPKKKGPIDAYILFEVCKSCQSFKRNANQIFNDICAKFPKKRFELVINDHGLSRRGSFEVTVSKKKGGSENDALIWSGIKKGPPRKLKFPESSALFDGVKSSLDTQLLNSKLD